MYLGLLKPTSPFPENRYRRWRSQGTHALHAIANSSEKCSCLGRTAMDVCSISGTHKCFLLVSFYRKNMFYRGSYFKRMQRLVDYKKENHSKSEFPTLVSRKTWLLHFIATLSAEFLVLYSEVLPVVFALLQTSQLVSRPYSAGRINVKRHQVGLGKNKCRSYE